MTVLFVCLYGRVVMGSEKENVESYENLLCLDDDLDLLHSFLVKTKSIFTKQKAKKLSGLTINLDPGLRNLIAQQRSRLICFDDEDEDSDTAEEKLSGCNTKDLVNNDAPDQKPSTSSTTSKRNKEAKKTSKHKILEVQLTKTEKMPKPAGIVLSKPKNRNTKVETTKGSPESKNQNAKENKNVRKENDN